MTGSTRIPRIIHQTWKTHAIPSRFHGPAESWRRRHPEWEYRLWTDDDLDAFVREEYPRLYGLYRSYPRHIMRVDAARYMILHRMGGLYADLDVECLRSFDAFAGHAVALPVTTPFGYSNDLMMAVPGHPFFARLLDRLEGAASRWARSWCPPYLQVMQATGSLFLTGSVRGWPDPEEIHRIAPLLYSSQDRASAYVYHHPGNTWGEWDARAIRRAYRHRWTTAAAGAAAVVWAGLTG
ncbi:MAG: glycosyltransferase [Gemmatimonadota bacterium]|nr:glycosyltransferase [Gemmatimonadota bacterium]MDH5761127.1 glycosyltransferase [Gemmatimonadota bacterium]